MKISLVETRAMHTAGDLTKLLNEKIEELEKDNKIIDIKYACAVADKVFLYSALIMYEAK